MDNLWIQAVPWLLVVIGWYFVNRTADGREARKEARATIDSAKKSILAISESAKAYFVSGSESASKIKSELELLEIELERLHRFAQSDLFVCFMAFQDACIGGEFESSVRGIHLEDSVQILQIQRTRNALIQQLEIRFTKRIF